MSKVLFWVVVILGLLLVSRLLARQAMRRRTTKPVGPRRQPPPARPQSMVQCAHCGIHLPASEAIQMQGDTWCSTEHARLGRP